MEENEGNLSNIATPLFTDQSCYKIGIQQIFLIVRQNRISVLLEQKHTGQHRSGGKNLKKNYIWYLLVWHSTCMQVEQGIWQAGK